MNTASYSAQEVDAWNGKPVSFSLHFAALTLSLSIHINRARKFTLLKAPYNGNVRKEGQEKSEVKADVSSFNFRKL